MARAKRRIRKMTRVTPCEHIDGGTYHIRPMEFVDAERYAEILTKQDFERDPQDGNRIIINQKTGQPIKRYAGDVHEQIDFAATLVERIEDVLVVDDDDRESEIVLVREDGEWSATDITGNELDRIRVGSNATGDAIFMTPAEFVIMLLTEMGTSEVEVDSEGREYAGVDSQVRLAEAYRDGSPVKREELKKVKALAGADFERGTKRIQENQFFWVTRESVRLRKEINEQARGNS